MTVRRIDGTLIAQRRIRGPFVIAPKDSGARLHCVSTRSVRRFRFAANRGTDCSEGSARREFSLSTSRSFPRFRTAALSGVRGAAAFGQKTPPPPPPPPNPGRRADGHESARCEFVPGGRWGKAGIIIDHRRWVLERGPVAQLAIWRRAEHSPHRGWRLLNVSAQRSNTLEFPRSWLATGGSTNFYGHSLCPPVRS